MTETELNRFENDLLSLIISNNRPELIDFTVELFKIAKARNPWMNLTDNWFNKSSDT